MPPCGRPGGRGPLELCMAPLPAPAEKTLAPRLRLPVSRQGQTTNPGGSLLRRPLAESSTGVDRVQGILLWKDTWHAFNRFPGSSARRELRPPDRGRHAGGTGKAAGRRPAPHAHPRRRLRRAIRTEFSDRRSPRASAAGDVMPVDADYASGVSLVMRDGIISAR